MTAMSANDLSLYGLALATESSLTPISASPATFKSVLDAVLSLLMDQQIAATLWAKLPDDPAWRDVLQQYCQGASPVAGPVYLLDYLSADRDRAALAEESDDFGDPAEEVFSKAGSYSTPHGITTPDPGIDDRLDPSSTLVSITLSRTSPSLKREHFLLVVSQAFCGLVIAHRPRSSRYLEPEPPSLIAATTTALKAEDPTTLNIRLLETSPMERRNPLLMLSSLSGQTVAAALGGLQQFLRDQEVAIDAIPWETLLAECQNYQPQIVTLSHLFAQQIGQQEDVWVRAAHDRRQAALVEPLRLQHEALSAEIRQKDDFLKNFAQELRSPLSTMKTALSLLASPQLKLPQRQRYQQLLSTECDRQNSLINGIMSLVQLEYDLEHESWQALNLADIVPAVVSTYQPLAQEKGIMLAYTIPEDLPQISGLSSWLKQIVIHLLSNGIKFTASGGKVWVTAKSQGEYVQLEFRDTGVGIPANEIPKIFDRFYQIRQATASDQGGAGLGLTIVKQILLRSSGSISVKSRPGEGSTFHVLLPIHRES